MHTRFATNGEITWNLEQRNFGACCLCKCIWTDLYIVEIMVLIDTALENNWIKTKVSTKRWQEYSMKDMTKEIKMTTNLNKTYYEI